MTRAAHPLPLDPKLDDPGWPAGRVPESGSWINVTTRSPATERTDAYFLYDDRNLYVAFKAIQNPRTIVATQTTNDVGFGVDDFVGNYRAQ